MDNLIKEIRRVQRRLAVQHFLGLLGWCWFAALVAAAIAIGAARIWPLESTTGIRDWHLLAGFLTTGLAVATVWTLLTLTPAIPTALEIDRRCGLKERVSSSLAMGVDDRQSEAGQALIADADNRLRRTAVMERFPVRPPRHLLLPLVPAALVVAAMFIWSPAERQVAAATNNSTVQPPAPEVKKSLDDLQQRLSQLRKQEEKKEGLKDATDLLKKIEEGANQAKVEPREKVLVKLNDLARELQERRKQLGGSGESLKRQMEQVQGVDQGPADKLAKALSKGDFEKAANELEKLQKQIADNKLDPAKKNDLAKQMEQLKQKIEQLAKQSKEAQAEMQKQADQMKQAGNPNAADKLEQEIQRLQQQGPQMDSLQGLCNKLGQCANQLKQGQNGQAAQSMQDAMQQMQEMAQRQSEMKTLDNALQNIADARRQMNCEKCGGKGCEACQGQGEGMDGNMAGDGKGNADGNGEKQGQVDQIGNGLGYGGVGADRPEAKADGRFYNSRVAQKVGQGGGQVTGLTDGPNRKNQAEVEIQKAAAEIEHGSTNPLSGLHLPKKQREHAQEYFDSFREGK
jgi:uncharacterized coiled-coil DUF342 family protein